ncbi:T9SS type A sorting domain-containing protein [Flavihumibacter stibioxidans]|uniref:Secretion system C-terminal sorting domain-containing protein n=1 Tax=Flavihumibacter stibioxidans TaxID=1834163 RepID=A0ABR7MDL5_9BACT|nr:T9SS type A sorting domain-containing protein [Flavihumibacter stibioxidans]MBC6492929.1 hypothetical protein [Flavihumibacter stibioxidans]
MRFTFTLICIFSFFTTFSQNTFVETFGTGTSTDVSTYTGYTGGLAGSNFSSTGTVSIETGSTVADGGSMVSIAQNSTFTISNIPTTPLTSIGILFYFNKGNGNGTRFFEVNTGSGWVADPLVNLDNGANNFFVAYTSSTYTVTGPISIRIRQVNGNNATFNFLDFITVGSPGTLPLLSRNFTATPVGSQVKLDWTGIATHMNSFFEVERSVNGKDGFQTLATIPVSATGEARYQYLDASPLKPEGHYRIRIVDENRRVSYSKTLKVNNSRAHFALDNLYPSVSTGRLNLLIASSQQQQARIEIIDQSGRLAMAQNLTINSGSQSYQINTSNISKGSYLLLLKKGDEVISSRFIKQ